MAHDVRYALRGLRRAPGLTLIAIVSLAVAIGTSTATFAVYEALMLRPLPVHDPDRLVTFKWSGADYTAFEVDSGDLAAYATLTAPFAGIAGVENVDRAASISSQGTAAAARASHVALVSPTYFTTLGVDAESGHLLSPADTGAAGRLVAVVSDAFWRTRLGGGVALGQTIRLSGGVFTIIGVAPTGFTGDWVGTPTDVWVPLAAHALVMPESPSRFQVRLLARLRDGVPATQARAASQVVYDRVKADWAASGHYSLTEQRNWAPRVDLQSLATGYSPQRRLYARPLQTLMITTGLLLLIACLNVAGLLVARGVARAREIAVRRALGVTQARLVRQLLTESAVLAAVGTASGCLFAVWATRVVASFVGSGPAPFLGSEAGPSPAILILNLHPDWRVIAVAALLSLATGALFGLYPALRAARVAPAEALTVRSDTAAGSYRLSPARTLVVAQITTALAMSVVGVLFASSLYNSRSQPLGFDRTNLLLVWTDPSQAALRGSRLTALWYAAIHRALTIPGVQSAAVTDMGLVNGLDARTGSEFFTVPGIVPRPGAHLTNTKVTPGFFATAGIPLLRGRDFSPFDTDSSRPVVILSQTIARFYFATGDPIGRQLDFTRPHTFGPYTVVGVVADTRDALRGTSDGVIYYPAGQSYRPTGAMVLVLRAAANAGAFIAPVRDALHAVGPDLPILEIDTVNQQLDAVLSTRRLLAALGEFFALVAVGLACLGIYGVLSYTTARRTREFGIRLALGATRAHVAGLILRDAIVLTGVGLSLGVFVSAGAVRLVQNQLFGIGSGIPVAMAGATLALLAAAGLAALFPVRRATMVDPLVALRAD